MFSLNKNNAKTDEESKMIVRMTMRDNRKGWIFYPEDRMKSWWDLIITLVLLVTCIETPYDIAFSDAEFSISYFNLMLDMFFILDIIVIFNSAFYSDDMDIIDSRKQIMCAYLHGWFFIDTLAVIPFDIVLNATSFNSLVRVARFGRLYKLVKLTRLLRVLKIFKQQNKLL